MDSFCWNHSPQQKKTSHVVSDATCMVGHVRIIMDRKFTFSGVLGFIIIDSWPWSWKTCVSVLWKNFSQVCRSENIAKPTYCNCNVRQVSRSGRWVGQFGQESRQVSYSLV